MRCGSVKVVNSSAAVVRNSVWSVMEVTLTEDPLVVEVVVEVLDLLALAVDWAADAGVYRGASGIFVA